MRVLVTGGAGFIGSHTADALLAAGHDVVILDALTEPVHRGGVAEYLPDGAEFIRGDVRDRDALERALRGVDAVYHLAAYQDYLPDFSTFFSVNAVGTALLYELIVERSLPVRRVVVASSQAVHGEGLYRCRTHGERAPAQRSTEQLARGEWEIRCPDCGAVLQWLPTPERFANPRNQYALSKHSQERMALSFGERYGVPSVAMRYSIVQGPRQSLYNAYSGVCRIFCLAYSQGTVPTAYEDGQALRDFVNIEDVVSANLRVLEADAAVGRAFNVGGGHAWTVNAFGALVAREYGHDEGPRLTGEYRFGDTRHSVSDITALRELGWAPRYGPEKSVADYAAWLRERTVPSDLLAVAEAEMRERAVVRAAAPAGG